MASSPESKNMGTLASQVNRSPSFRSIDRRSGGGDGRQSQGTTGAAPSQTAVLEGAERFFSQLKRGAASRRVVDSAGIGGGLEWDGASDTSSQQERKFAALIGGPDPHDLIGGIGGTGDGPAGYGYLDAGAGAATGNIGRRLYLKGMHRLAEREERLQSVREQILMQEMSEMTQRPAITKKARLREPKGRRFADHSMEWVDAKNEHLRQLKEEMLAAEVEGLQSAPSIDQRSNRIVSQLDEYQGPVYGWASHFAKFCAKKNAAAASGDTVGTASGYFNYSPSKDHRASGGAYTFQPSINSNAVRADAHKDISERLFDDASARTGRLKQFEEAQRDKELTDPTTGRPFFAPQSLEAPHTREPRSPSKVVEDLLEEGRRNERRREARKEALVKGDPHLTFSPSINPKSALLADGVATSPTSRGKNTGDNDGEQQRKLKPRRSLHNLPTAASTARRLEVSQARSSQRGASKEPSKSPSRGGHHVDPNAFIARSEQRSVARQQRIEALQKDLLESERRQCSFQPRLSRHSVAICEKLDTYAFSPAFSDEPSLVAIAPLTANGGDHHNSGRRDGSAATRFSQKTSGKSPRMVGLPPTGDDTMAAFSPGGDVVNVASPLPRQVSSYTQQQPSPHMPFTQGPFSQPPLSDLHAGLTSPHQRHLAALAQPPSSSMPQVDAYVSSFEQQMFAVLDEWKRVEGDH